jgi:hypothetical protein
MKESIELTCNLLGRILRGQRQEIVRRRPIRRRPGCVG